MRDHIRGFCAIEFAVSEACYDVNVIITIQSTFHIQGCQQDKLTFALEDR